MGAMSRVTFILRHAIDSHQREIGEYTSWDQALAIVKDHCGGTLPSASPVPTNTSDWSFTNVRRVVDFSRGHEIFRVTQYER